ncbi:MAG: site-2 protease family protein [Deltaproteobacteria bacterium]|nr:site-2 protease family protein [Deltaproteobacteria bacterium]
MALSWRLGTVSGIPVRLHITMLLIPFLLYSKRSLESPLAFAVETGIVVLLFGSVLLHELGHALMARRFGVRTLDIVLTPIGGMARVIDMPSRPRHEIAIALAGPLVSLGIAGLGLVLGLAVSAAPFVPRAVDEGVVYLAGINLMLGVFNLVPALPMDGGRVLRGYLALKRDFLTATRMAARVGRIIAVAGFIAALLWLDSWSLAAIAVFVYLAAGGEERMALWREMQKQGSAGGPTQAGFPGVRTFVWTWPSQNGGPQRPSGWAEPGGALPDRREVIVVEGGKVEVISRKDPDGP